MKFNQLDSALESFNKDYVDINPSEMTEMLEIYNKVIFEVFTILKKDNKCCKIDFPIGRGSSFEDLKVVEPDEFDVLIPLKITETNWFIEECRKDPCFVRITDVHGLDDDTIPLNCKDGKYLSATSVLSSFQGGIQRFVNKYDGDYKLNVSTKGPAITQLQRKSFSDGERYCAMSLPIEAKKILKITKAIKLNLRPTPMDTVPSYIYKTAMTH
ncbi:hypothetical protein CAPTEDRAFT_217436, partial [Capitella teleta]